MIRIIITTYFVRIFANELPSVPVLKEIVNFFFVQPGLLIILMTDQLT